MEKKIINEIEKIRLSYSYNPNKTLTENVKKLLLEGGIPGLLNDVIGAMFKSGKNIAPDVSDNVIEVGGSKYTVKTGVGVYGRDSLVDSSGRDVDSINIGGKSISADDIIKINRKEFSELSDEFTNDYLNIAMKAADDFTEIGDELVKIANDKVASIYPETIETAITLAKRLVGNGKSIDEALDEVLKSFDGLLEKEEIELLRKYFFKRGSTYARIMAQKGSKTIIKLTAYKFNSFMANLIRMIKQYKGTKEIFLENIEKRVLGWVETLDQIPITNEKDIAKAYRTIKQDLELLINENTFKEYYNQSWPEAQKRAIVELLGDPTANPPVTGLIPDALKQSGMTDDEINAMISRLKNKLTFDIDELFEELKKEITDIEDLNIGAFDGVKSKIKSFLGMKEDASKFWEYFINFGKKLFGSVGGTIFKFVSRCFRVLTSMITVNVWRIISLTHWTGTTRTLTELMQMLTRYGKGRNDLLKAFIRSLGELYFLKFVVSPIAYSFIFLLSSLLEGVFDLLQINIDISDENKKFGDYVLSQYTKWFTDPSVWSEVQTYLPIVINTDLLKTEFNYALEAGTIVLDTIMNASTEEDVKQKNEKEIEDAEKKLEDDATKAARESADKAFTNDEVTTLYVDKFYGDYEDIKQAIENASGSLERLKLSNNLTDSDVLKLKNSMKVLSCPGKSEEEYVSIKDDLKNLRKSNAICAGIWNKEKNKFYEIKIDPSGSMKYNFVDDDGTEKPLKDVLSKNLAENYKIKMFDMKNLIRKIILEEEEEKTLKMKDWDEIFSFQKVDEKESGKYTDVKIKMDSVMDRMPHWRKKYKKQCEDIDNCDDDGEDDSFVRAVIDTHPEVVRVLFTKGMAHLTSSDDQEDLNESLHGLLAFLRESKNVEVEVWSVYRHPSSPDKIWSLVKGDYKPKELSSMDKKMQQSPGNSVEKKKDSLSELKKKESEAIRLLSTDEKKGLMELPIKVRNRVKEMIKKGWTTEKPSDSLMSYYKEDGVDSVFEEPIKVYKLRPNQTFFNFIKSQKSDDEIKRGFCRSIYYIEKEFDLPKEVSSKIDDILNKCENKLEGKYGQNYL